MKEQVTKRWLVVSGKPQKGQEMSPDQSFLDKLTLVYTLFCLSSQRNTFILRGMLAFQMES